MVCSVSLFNAFAFNNQLCKLMLYSVKFGLLNSNPFWKELLTLLAICLFCGCFIVIVCLSRWCWGLNMDLIVSVSEFSC